MTRKVVSHKTVLDLCALCGVDSSDFLRVVGVIRKKFKPRSIRFVEHLTPLGSKNGTWEIWR